MLRNDAIVAPAPGKTPIKKPITEFRGIVFNILALSSLLISGAMTVPQSQ